MQNDKITTVEKTDIYRINPDSGELVSFKQEDGTLLDDLIKNVKRNMAEIYIAIAQIAEKKLYLLKDCPNMESFIMGELGMSRSSSYEYLKNGRYLYEQMQLQNTPTAEPNDMLVKFIDGMGHSKITAMAKVGVSLESLEEGILTLPDGSTMEARIAISMSRKEFSEQIKAMQKVFQNENEKFFSNFELVKAENESYKKMNELKDAEIREYRDQFAIGLSNVKKNETYLKRLQELLYDAGKLIEQINIGENPESFLVDRLFDAHSLLDRHMSKLRDNNIYAFGGSLNKDKRDTEVDHD